MITTEKKIGRPTARQAGRTTSRTSPRTGSVAELLAEPVHHVLGHHDRRVDQHADRDRDPGQRHDVGLDVDDPQPPQDRHDQRTTPRAASGSVTAMTNDVRTCSRTTRTQTEAETSPRRPCRVTVPIAPSISGVRS